MSASSQEKEDCEAVLNTYNGTLQEAQALSAKAKASASNIELSRSYYTESAKSYEKAYALCDRRNDTRYNIALMYKKAGNCARARESMLDFINGALDPAKRTTPELIPRAKEHLAALEAECGRSTVKISCDQQGVMLRLSAQDTPKTCPATFNLKPGKYTLQAEASGFVTRETPFEVSEGVDVQLTVPTLKALAPTPAPKPASAEQPDQDAPLVVPPKATSSKGAFLIGGGLAAVAGVGLLTWGVVKTVQTNDLVDRRAIAGGDLNEQRSQSRNLFIAGGVLTALGGVAIGAGFLLNKETPKAGDLTVIPQGNAISVSVSF